MAQPLPFPGHGSPSAGFDQPFDMLAACHERVQRTLGLLHRLVDHVGVHGADDPARSAAADVLRYFDVAAPAHHEDEERHVIPRLLASEDASRRALAQRLLDDHRRMHDDWQGLRVLLQGVRDGHVSDTLDLRERAARFGSRYAEHLQLEDEQAFPSAEGQLQREGPSALQQMGDEMAQRRGARRAVPLWVSPPPG